MTPDQAGELVARIEEQERRLVLARFDNEDAWRLGTLLVELARARGAVVAIDIRRNTQQLFHYALPGTSADNDAWIQRKACTTGRSGHASYLVRLRHLAQGNTFEQRSHLRPDTYAAHGGAFPIILEGTGAIGTVTVSGLAQDEAHELVTAALEEYLARG
ncbi:heme-degrading domain-containing protein [Kitasatospora sp. GAS204B]|uniref:heme-degrading domain-containing protein n=1 Tax=unclassified Kitasatospora TaxID=2633591 RepID=UPI00247431B5|nr:heme-degrading domain-containing protein [Kitasatospora sp. GAS204B]MDH6117951.1 uncharacterized protein (UPF0303 family) [Kitasatospora sp. GAS204B]